MRVRFTAWHAYPLFDARDSACVGGAETRAWLLATGLAQRPGFEIDFVVHTPRRFQEQRCGAISVCNIGDPWDAWRNNVARSLTITRDPLRIRFHKWDWRLLWQAPLLSVQRLASGPPSAPDVPAAIYFERQADVECCFGVSAQSAAVVEAARRNNAISILSLASNSDLDARFTSDSMYVTVHGERGDVCRRALDGATKIICQHTEQQRLLKERFGRDGVVLPNPIDLAEWDRAATPPSQLVGSLAGQRFALWVGRADDFHKRPLLCLELARRLPRARFVMVLNPGDELIERAVRTEKPNNVLIVPSVPFAEMPMLLSASAVYVSTGSREYEGSPNLFLQAAASRIPIASLDVSTPLIAGTGAGFVANGDVDQLAKYVGTMIADPGAARAAGEAGRRFVEREHSQLAIVDRLIELLNASRTA
ncbi:MAG: glycosyltransferase family 4 protein [Planctomycetaceae bacterium]